MSAAAAEVFKADLNRAVALIQGRVQREAQACDDGQMVLGSGTLR